MGSASEGGSWGKCLQQAEITMVEPRLQGTSEIAVPHLRRFCGSANRPQALRHFLRKHFAERRRLIGFGPGHLRACAVMREVIQPQAEAVPVRHALKTHDVAESIELFRVGLDYFSHHRTGPEMS